MRDYWPEIVAIEITSQVIWWAIFCTLLVEPEELWGSIKFLLGGLR